LTGEVQQHNFEIGQKLQLQRTGCSASARLASAAVRETIARMRRRSSADARLHMAVWWRNGTLHGGVPMARDDLKCIASAGVAFATGISTRSGPEPAWSARHPRTVSSAEHPSGPNRPSAAATVRSAAERAARGARQCVRPRHPPVRGNADKEQSDFGQLPTLCARC
jgi:hypothetical protein